MSQAAVNQAVKLYEDFREASPKSIGAVRVKVPKAVACIGYVEAIDYRTTHGKKLTLYRHDFLPGSRPLLAVSSDGLQLLLLGGRYKFTRQGIVDKDARGKLITNPKHGKNINPRGRAQTAKLADGGTARLFPTKFGRWGVETRDKAGLVTRQTAYRVKADAAREFDRLKKKPARKKNPGKADYFAMGKKLAESGARTIEVPKGLSRAQFDDLLDGYSNGRRLADRATRRRK